MYNGVGKYEGQNTRRISKKEKAQIKREIVAEQKKRRLQKTDGLGPLEIKKIRQALRLVWQRSHARKLVVVRCTDKAGFTFCEQCKERTPNLKIDHVQKVGDVDGGFITRLFVPSHGLQGLCHPCHNAKTKLERSQTKRSRVSKWGF